MDQADTTTQAEVFADASKNPVAVLRVWADMMEQELRPASEWKAAIEDMRIAADRLDDVAAMLRAADDTLAEAAGLLSYDSPVAEADCNEMREHIAAALRAPLTARKALTVTEIAEIRDAYKRIEDAAVAAERDACKQIARQHEEASRELGFDGAANAAASIAETISARGRGEAEPLLTPPASKG
jgi:hypothetical protein